MVCRLAVDIFTTRLAVAVAPDEHVALVAVDVSPVSADPALSAVPDVCPVLPAHSTLYGTVSAPLASVKAVPVPLPVAVTLYPRVLVLLHTQTFCAFAAGVAGSWFKKETSVRPVSCTRFGTDAPIEIDPVEVVPRLP
ncbi:hypothetical protein GCM10022276_12010 [Sphingomonas limnosediminicola]|uniref:Secreted protein n=1 Tax=Sphingomonas limnosediminicola TaxID=940133 RepID=A0ABP7L793_9SPHN